MSREYYYKKPPGPLPSSISILTTLFPSFSLVARFAVPFVFFRGLVSPLLFYNTPVFRLVASTFCAGAIPFIFDPTEAFVSPVKKIISKMAGSLVLRLGLLAVLASKAWASCAYGTLLHPRAEEGTVDVNIFGYTGEIVRFIQGLD